MKALTPSALAVLAALAGCGGELPKLDHGGGGLDLSVVYKGSVRDPIRVEVAVDGQTLQCGALGSQEGKDARAILPGSPVQIGRDIVVRWQKTPDGPQRETTLSTAPYAAAKDRIRAVRLEYHGGDQWVLKCFDGKVGNKQRQEIRPGASA